MKINKKLGLLSLSFGLLLSNIVDAQVYEWTFMSTNNESVSVKPGVNFFSPVSPISLTLMSGLDRYVKVTAHSSAGEIVYQNTSTLITVSDRIKSSDGTEFYGKKVIFPALSDGTYKVSVEILDLKKLVVGEYGYSFTIDTSPPVFTRIFPDPNAGYNMVLSGDVWELGLSGSGQHNIFIDGLDDSSGIKDVRLQIKNEDGSLFSDTPLKYDVDAKRAYYTWVHNYATQPGMPSDDLYKTFTFNFIATDTAGNQLHIPAQKFKFDNQIGEYTLFAVFNDSATTSVVPGIQSGYVSYVKGMNVTENPYRVVYRVPKTNYAPYRKGGIGFSNSYGGVKLLSTDDNYVYIELKVPQGTLDGNFIRINNTYQWGGGTIANLNSLFDFRGTSVKSPEWSGNGIERQDAEGNWFGSAAWKLIQSSELPFKMKGIRFTVQARPYEQRISGAYPCIVAIGETQCSVSFNYTAEPGTTGYLHNPYQITSTTEAAFRTLKYENVAWMDNGAPSITSFSYSESANSLTVNIHQHLDSAYFDYVKLKRVWLSNAIDGKDLPLSAKQVSRNTATGNYIYQFDLKSLPEGRYDIKINAVDTLGNSDTRPYKTMVIDQTPPSISVTYADQPIASNVTVYGLENISIKLNDALTTPRITRMTLAGGPVTDAVGLSWANIGTDLYHPEYPRLFPSIEADSGYTLTIEASDEMNNKVTKTVTFNYLPNNLVQLENLKTLAVSTPLKTSTGVPLAVLKATLLRKNDGSIATGAQAGLLTLRRDAGFPITVNGVTVQPGETKELTLDLGKGEGATFPVYPAEAGQVGSADFIIEFPQIE